MSAFDQAFAIVIGHEGGYSNEREDAGNWTGGIVGVGICKGTKYGISAAAYPGLEIAALSLDGAKDIYRRDYWQKIRGNDLPPPLALLVFDAAVNNGPAQAVRWLQAAANVTIDGIIGPHTLSAVAQAQGATLCAEFQAQRTYFMANLATWRTFGMGWARRLCALPYQSLTMTGD